MDVSSERLIQIIELIYDATDQPEKWPTALENLASSVGAATASIVEVDFSSPGMFWGKAFNSPDEIIRQYNEYYYLTDPMLRFYPIMKPGELLPFESLVPMNKLRTTEFWSDFVSPGGFGTGLTGKVTETGRATAGLSMMFSDQMDILDADIVRFVNAVSPHLGKALNLERKLRLGGHLHRDGVAVDDGMMWAVIELDDHGQVVNLNSKAQELVRNRDGITVEQRELRFDRHVQQQYVESVRALLGRTTSVGSSATDFVAPRRNGCSPFKVFVGPKPRRSGPKTASVVVLLCETMAEDDRRKALGEKYDLTPAESALVNRLTVGRSLAESADDIDVTYETARSRLKDIFVKTDTHTQAQLVALVLSDPFYAGTF